MNHLLCTSADQTHYIVKSANVLQVHASLSLAFTKLLSANGDGEIRTLDPLLARQVLSQLSYTPTVRVDLVQAFPVCFFNAYSICSGLKYLFRPEWA